MNGTQKDTAPLTRERRKPPKQNGPAIRALREKDTWSQDAFAKAVGICQSSLSDIEREASDARITTLNRIARKLHVPLDAIMRDRDAPPVARLAEPEGAAAA